MTSFLSPFSCCPAELILEAMEVVVQDNISVFSEVFLTFHYLQSENVWALHSFLNIVSLPMELR